MIQIIWKPLQATSEVFFFLQEQLYGLISPQHRKRCRLPCPIRIRELFPDFILLIWVGKTLSRWFSLSKVELHLKRSWFIWNWNNSKASIWPHIYFRSLSLKLDCAWKSPLNLAKNEELCCLGLGRGLSSCPEVKPLVLSGPASQISNVV